MAVDVHLNERDNALVVGLSGWVRTEVLALIGSAIREIGEPGSRTVLDLDELVADRPALDALVSPLTPSCGFDGVAAIACSPATRVGRLVQAERPGLPVFASVEEALALIPRQGGTMGERVLVVSTPDRGIGAPRRG